MRHWWSSACSARMVSILYGLSLFVRGVNSTLWETDIKFLGIKLYSARDGD